MRATLVLEAVDESGQPQRGAIKRTLFSDEVHAKGDFSMPFSAGDFGSGSFRYVLKATSLVDGTADEAADQTWANFKESNCCPSGKLEKINENLIKAGIAPRVLRNPLIRR